MNSSVIRYSGQGPYTNSELWIFQHIFPLKDMNIYEKVTIFKLFPQCHEKKGGIYCSFLTAMCIKGFFPLSNEVIIQICILGERL